MLWLKAERQQNKLLFLLHLGQYSDVAMFASQSEAHLIDFYAIDLKREIDVTKQLHPFSQQGVLGTDLFP